MKTRKDTLRTWILLEEKVSKAISNVTEIIIKTEAEDDSSLCLFEFLARFFKDVGKEVVPELPSIARSCCFSFLSSPTPSSFHEEQYLPLAQGCWPKQGFVRGR